MSHFSTTLRQLRKQRHLTQQQLADTLQVSKSRINMYERGEREPNFQMLQELSHFFDVDINFLLGPLVTFRDNSNLMTILKKDIDAMNLSAAEIFHAVAIYSSQRIGIDLPSTPIEKKLIENYAQFFHALSYLDKGQLHQLLSYADYRSQDEKAMNSEF